MKETLETKLNKEYKNIGTVTINEMHEDIIPVSEIAYVGSIMKMIEPLDIDEPLVVGKTWRDEYTLIDGYHRLKNKIRNGEKEIKVIVLDKYKINRTQDTLFRFIQGLIGQKIRFIDSEIMVVDGKYYEIKSNAGCGGCGNGWSSLDVNKKFINKEITVKTVATKDQNEDVYDLYVNGVMVARVDTGYGNGYYGGDFEVCLRN
jgi:hypothetical protein